VLLEGRPGIDREHGSARMRFVTQRLNILGDPGARIIELPRIVAASQQWNSENKSNKSN
jgi:hypothetical protein